MTFDKPEYEEQTFENISLDGQKLTDVKFSDCVFNGCSFEKTTFVNCTFDNCTFTRCGLTLTKLLGVTFKQACFEECKIIGVEFDSNSLNTFLANFNFSGCKIMSCSFTDIDLSGMVTFDGTTFCETSFEECKLISVGFAGCDFSDSRFIRCDLTSANFANAAGFDIDPRYNQLTDAKFSPANVIELLACFDIEII